MNNFLDAARQGKNHWWRYTLGIFLILFSWLIIGGIVSVIALVVVFAIVSANQTALGLDLPSEVMDIQEILTQTPPAIAYFIQNIPAVSFLLSLLFVVCIIHRRNFFTLIRGDRSVRWWRFWQGFGLWFILLSGINFIGYFLDPGSFKINFNPISWLVFVVPAFFVIVLQSGVEELFFRGYLLQGIRLL